MKIKTLPNGNLEMSLTPDEIKIVKRKGKNTRLGFLAKSSAGGFVSSAVSGFPPILDACCGGRQFWFDKKNPHVLFADCRVMPDKVVGTGKNARTRRCLPCRVHDFRAMEYPDETFQMVVFDPPHLFLGVNSFMAQSYGRLERETWRDDLSRGFAECFRVLKTGGVLIFKWNECDVPLAEILKCTPNKPLFGHPSGKAQKTHWCAFWKPNVPWKIAASDEAARKAGAK